MCAQALSSEQNTVFLLLRGTIQQLSLIFQKHIRRLHCWMGWLLRPDLQIHHRDYTDYSSVAHMTTSAVIQIEYIMTNLENGCIVIALHTQTRLFDMYIMQYSQQHRWEGDMHQWIIWSWMSADIYSHFITIQCLTEKAVGDALHRW